MRISDWSSDVCSSDLEGRQPDTPAAFRKAKPSRNLFPHSGTAFSSNCVAAIPAQRVTTSRGEPNRLSPNSARRSRGDFRSAPRTRRVRKADRSEEHTSELQSLMRSSYAVFCLKTKKKPLHETTARQLRNE